MNSVHEDGKHDEHHYEQMLHVHSVNKFNKIDPILLHLKVKEQPLNMELDTGSSMSIKL